MNVLPVCPTCMGRMCGTSQRHASFSWAVLWRCPICDVHFHFCDRTCGPKSSQNTAFASHDQLVRHHRRNHKKQRLELENESGDIIFADQPLLHTQGVEEVPRFQISVDAYPMFHLHLPTQLFFGNIRTYSFSVAVQRLVARSCYLDSHVADTSSTEISVSDLILFFRIARLVFQLGPKHQNLFGEVLSGFETRYRPSLSFYLSSQFYSGLQLPTTHKAFLSKILNNTNTNSLASIIPIPPRICLSGKHAYVSIPTIVAYDLGMADPVVDAPYNEKFDRLVNSPHGQKLIERSRMVLMEEQTTIDCTHTSYVPLVVLFMMWFDGWDPNRSSKGNRSPVWSGSLTMVLVNLFRARWFQYIHLSICSRSWQSRS